MSVCVCVPVYLGRNVSCAKIIILILLLNPLMSGCIDSAEIVLRVRLSVKLRIMIWIYFKLGYYIYYIRKIMSIVIKEASQV